MGNKKHKPPSRIKYEQNHPTVSFRLEKSLRDKLNSFLEKKKISKPDFIKIALKEQEETYDIAYNEGYKMGYEVGKKEGKDEGVKEGKEKWAIWATCWECHELLYIEPNSENHKQTIKVTQGYLKHTKCPKEQ